MKISRKCPMCGKTTEMDFTKEQLGQYQIYCNGVGYIQDINATPSEREFLKTGYCVACQKILFTPPELSDEDIAFEKAMDFLVDELGLEPNDAFDITENLDIEQLIDFAYLEKKAEGKRK